MGLGDKKLSHKLINTFIAVNIHIFTCRMESKNKDITQEVYLTQRKIFKGC